MIEMKRMLSFVGEHTDGCCEATPCCSYENFEEQGFALQAYECEQGHVLQTQHF